MERGEKKSLYLEKTRGDEWEQEDERGENHDNRTET